MKKGYKTMVGLTVLPTLITLLSMVVMPNSVPLHYNFDGEVTRIGSKYGLLLLPFIIVITGLLFLCVVRNLREKGREHNANMMYRVGCATLLFFTILTVAMLLLCFKNADGRQEQLSLTFVRIMFFGMGLLILLIGNWMPKVKCNGAFGFRTKWTMENDDNWFRAQRAGGWLFIVAGVAILLASTLIVKEATSTFVCTGIIIAMIPGCLLLSYVLSKRKF